MQKTSGPAASLIAALIMSRIRYFLIPAALLVFANWAIHAYRHSVLDVESLAYGQSVIVPGGATVGRGSVNNSPPFATSVKANPPVISLERTGCFGACPPYLLEID